MENGRPASLNYFILLFNRPGVIDFPNKNPLMRCHAQEVRATVTILKYILNQNDLQIAELVQMLWWRQPPTTTPRNFIGNTYAYVLKLKLNI